MPRKHDSHWGEDGFEDPEEEFDVADPDVDELVEVLGDGVVGKKRAWLADQVRQIGVQFWRGYKRGASKYTRAEARQALEQLIKEGSFGYAKLSGLNERALDCLFNALLVQRPPPETAARPFSARSSAIGSTNVTSGRRPRARSRR